MNGHMDTENQHLDSPVLLCLGCENTTTIQYMLQKVNQLHLPFYRPINQFGHSTTILYVEGATRCLVL